jgi:NADPH:quinone reductase-like Zn-dependent oxidoreductase
MQRNENGISMKIVIIGATGLVGSIVVHLLTEHGHDALVGGCAEVLPDGDAQPALRRGGSRCR